ncbi:hypothetical protein NA56DRAFT_756282 [Hyaloscypha hepaticicola]|uniref:Uncharacterized protein n=1 Tax=Hyaloscypha hepaticicola TaxID=2082293 RepID=A0A2J6PFS8_9HELO|nr:hypothetical protein NA56DRAFT_756282 [Hyaloscypha hepaticicola]
MANQDSITPARGFEEVEEVEEVEKVEMIEIVEEVVGERDLERNSQADHNPSTDRGTKSVFILSFKGLQLRRIEMLQRSILDLSTPKGGVENKTREERHTQLDELLKRYAKAVRDYETLLENAIPFLPWKASISIPDILPNDITTHWVRELPGGTGFNWYKWISITSRYLLFGYIGALSIVIPVRIMTSHLTLHTCLVTTGISTLLFGLILSCLAAWESILFEDKDLLSAITAYAAVLVVFVGTSLTITHN